MNSYEKTCVAVKALDSKKARDITVLKIEDLTVISDYFVIATASSSTQLRALSDEVDFVLGEAGIAPLHKEGDAQSPWILLDYGDIVVHLFLEDSRMFYSLERLWSDATKVDVEEILK
ncbi:MAG: ribosome silencing factor [Clostridia bacterium]|nr:ribosome silencing factor [Clostridia bacterium]